MSDTATAKVAPKDIDLTRISDADIERERAQIGIPQFLHGEAFNTLVSKDGIKHFAYGFVADDNPLWHDESYASQTRWRGPIAPPLFLVTTGISETPPYDTPEKKAMFKGLYLGVGRYNVGTKWKLFRPVRPGDVIYKEMSVDDVQVKAQSSFSGARTVLDRIRHLYVDQNGNPIAVRYEHFVNAERAGSKKTNKHADITRQHYTPDMIAKIDAHYAAEEIRGANKRWWEDVSVGDQIVPVIKGPLGTMDIIAAHLGWGLGDTYGAGPFRYDWKTRQKLKNFYNEDEYGIPRSMMRVHWDQRRAEDLGLPAPYDYGQMRTNWMTHAITNWMGDDAWIADLHTEIRGFNFHGDTTLITGEVTEKIEDGSHRAVVLTIRGTNQRELATCFATATIRLPSRDAGPAVLPLPDEDLRERGARMMVEASERQRNKA
jgi:acyl dehydratase